MNREEILAKSKAENVYGDEYEKKIRTHRDAFFGWGTTIICIVIMIIKLYRTESPADIISILFCSSATAFMYEAVHTKKKYLFVVAIVLYLAAIYFFYKFCVGTF